MKSAGNAVIPTFPMHRSHGLQGSLKRRYKHPSPTSINGYHTAKNSCRNRLQNGLHSLLRMKVGTHTRLCQQDRTQRLTRRNRGCFGWGRYYYPRRALRAAETPDGRLSKRLTCRFLRSGEQRSLRSAYFFEYTEFSVGSSSCKHFYAMVQ